MDILQLLRKIPKRCQVLVIEFDPKRRFKWRFGKFMSQNCGIYMPMWNSLLRYLQNQKRIALAYYFNSDYKYDVYINSTFANIPKYYIVQLFYTLYDVQKKINVSINYSIIKYDKMKPSNIIVANYKFNKKQNRYSHVSSSETYKLFETVSVHYCPEYTPFYMYNLKTHKHVENDGKTKRILIKCKDYAYSTDISPAGFQFE